jgi:galactokinase
MPGSPSLEQIDYRVSAPGRVNLLGEHVDYNQGVVLPAAIDRRVRLQAKLLPNPIVWLHAADLDAETAFTLDSLHLKKDLQGNPLPAWALYPAGVAWALQQRGLQPSGIRVSYSSDIPIGAGLSSSAAVEVAFSALWQGAAGWPLNRLELALICQQAEVEYVGVNCGAMDQITSACGVAEHALQIDMRSLDVKAIPLPGDLAIVIADSGVPRTLAGSAYNDRRAACEQAVRILSEFIPGITSLRDVSVTDFNRYAGRLPEQIHMFARHVVEEMTRVNEAVRALEAGDVDAFGRLMLAGHASLRDLYLVSTPELDVLVEIARDLPGCWGARLTGAGFGGCTVNLVEARYVDDFIQRLSIEYWQTTGRRAQVYACRASQGATVSAA